MESPIEVESRGAVEILTLNRPHRLNALDEAMIEALAAYFTGLTARLEARVVIMRAEGRAFCAGLDLAAWEYDGTRGKMQHDWNTQRRIGYVMQAMRLCPQPVIACAQGPACGGGFSFLLASDVRYGAPDLRMNAAYIRIGLGGCDMGSSYFLPRLIGSSIANEYLLTGRFMTAQVGRECGLLSAIVPHEELLGKALSLADEMLANTPMGLRMTKEALNLNIDAASMAHAFALEDRQQIMLNQTEDSIEAKSAFLEKRDAKFHDR